MEYGGLTLQVSGDFDACLRQVRAASDKLGLYLMNSVNPFRLEGQKAIIYRILEARNWEVPDWIVVPGGNLGNSAAFGKALMELHELGLINRLPRLAIINATGANTLFEVYEKQGIRWNGGNYDIEKIDAHLKMLDDTGYEAHTVASAIEIGRPVNLTKALRSLEVCDGVVRQVSDEQIMEHKAMIGRFGFGCEPASAASVTGLHVLQDEGVIGKSDSVVCILTGHLLKDPDATIKYHTGIDMKKAKHPDAGEVLGKLANRPIQVADDLESICKVLGENTPTVSDSDIDAFPSIAPLEMEC